MNIEKDIKTLKEIANELENSNSNKYALDLIEDWLDELENMPKLSGCELIGIERARQINKEGWTSEHDDTHLGAELALAAACYATPDACREFKESGFFWNPHPFKIPTLWPWPGEWYKPAPNLELQSRIKELTKAGALIAAEIDRLIRLKE